MNVRQGDDVYLGLLAQHNAILRRRLRQFDGVEIKHTGDGIASWFSSAAGACECALATRDDLAEHNASHPDTPFFVRFGLASGSPIAHEGDLFGVSVSLAARLCAQAAAGQVLVAEEIASAIRSERLSFRALEPMALRGFPEPVPVFAVGPGSG
jgi:class 3 adenylate cyclase